MDAGQNSLSSRHSQRRPIQNSNSTPKEMVGDTAYTDVKISPVRSRNSRNKAKTKCKVVKMCGKKPITGK
jgi:hypothetical protein